MRKGIELEQYLLNTYKMQNKTQNPRDAFFTQMTKDYILISYKGETLLKFEQLEQAREPREQVMLNHKKAQGIIRDIIAGKSKYITAQARYAALTDIN